MRPRFSIRLLFVVVALSAAVLYFLFVRPTVTAERFVEAVGSGHYFAAESLFIEPIAIITQESKPGRTIDRVYAEVLPREWSDIWAFQRRLLLRIRFQDDTGAGRVEWAEDTDIVARLNGLRIKGGDL